MSIREVWDSKEGKLTVFASATALIVLLGFLGFNNTIGAFAGGNDFIPVNSCNVQGIYDGRYEFSCSSISQSSVGDSVVFYTDDYVTGLVTYEQGSPDLFQEMMEGIILKETSLTNSNIGVGNECATDDQDQPVICVDRKVDEVESLLSSYGGFDYTSSDYELSSEWERMYAPGTSMMEGVVDSYKEYSTCTAGVIWDDWNADEGDRTQFIPVNGTIGYHETSSDGIGCKVENPDPGKFGHVEDVKQVSWSIDLNRIDHVTGFVLEDTGQQCTEKRFVEGSEPEAFFDSEQACIDHYEMSENIEVEGPRNVTVSESVEYTAQLGKSVDDAASISWSNGETGDTATYTWDSVGEKTVEVTVNNGFSETSQSIEISVEKKSLLAAITDFFEKIWTVITFSG